MDLHDVENFLVILIDETKIYEFLVWSKQSGNLYLLSIFCVCALNLNYAAFQKADTIASHSYFQV